VALAQSPDTSHSSTHCSRVSTVPGEGDVYNLGVIESSHAWPANVMVETSRSATIMRVELDARNSDHKRVDDIIF